MDAQLTLIFQYRINLGYKTQALRVCLDIIYSAKTENWKHCSKIIFKYVNSTMGPIFNEKIAEKWNLWVRKQCMDALFTMEKSTFAATVQWTVTVATLLLKRVKRETQPWTWNSNTYIINLSGIHWIWHPCTLSDSNVLKLNNRYIIAYMIKD